MNILIVEDNEHKRNKVSLFIHNIDDSFVVYEAASYNSGLKIINENKFDIIILDMSLPTHDKSVSESGGRFRIYGGKDILRKMKKKNIMTPFVILTQYSNFGEGDNKKTIHNIFNELKEMYKDQHLDTIHYETSSSLWKEKLKKIIEGINV